MTDTPAAPPTAQTKTPGKTLGRLERVANQLRQLDRQQATGELAALRRMDHREPPPSALFCVLARAQFRQVKPVNVPRWSAIVAVMAQRPDALSPGRLGKTMAEAGFSEQRLDTLLHARGETLFALVRRTSLRLALAEGPLPYRDLCLLLLYEGREESALKADRVRIRIAKDFVRYKKPD
jgi:hypothetical protein